MSVHYNAFISYRHSPVDSRVAAEIQRKLEHFSVPRSIREKTGVKRISRIFRDKEELPITSDLNDDIAQALAGSDYLIVICSPRTGESVWVQREIETFLKNHTRRQVLTVLAEGEPQEIIPEILRYDQAADPDTGALRRVPIEPLSCDWRAPSRRAKREELPRLAAALLGCAYDELRQRQRQYRMRRVTAAFSAALAVSLALTAYFVRTGMTIRENYRQALRNQSRYLAAESLDRLEEGDRITAILLALEALPEEGDDRPLVPEAEYALGCGVQAYATEASDLVAVGALTPDGRPREIMTSEHGERVCIRDSLGLFTIWETEQFQRIQTIKPQRDADKFLFTRGGFLLVRNWQGIDCYDGESGTLLWTREIEMADVFARPDSDELLVYGEDEQKDQALFLLDLETGETLRRLEVPLIDGEETPPDRGGGLSAFSEDGSRMALAMPGDDYRYYVLVYDLTEGAGRYMEQSFQYLNSLCFTASGDIAAIGAVEASYGASSQMFDYTNLSLSGYDVLCMSAETGRSLWSGRLEYYQVSYGAEIFQLQDSRTLLCTASNVCWMLDQQTGEVVGRCETPASIVTAVPGETSARLALRDGSVGFYSYDENRCTSKPVLVDELTSVSVTEDEDGWLTYFTLQRYGTQVLIYRGNAMDERWEGFENGHIDGSIQSICRGGGYLALMDYEQRLYLYDIAVGGLSAKVELDDGETSYQYELLGFDADESHFLLCRKARHQNPAALLVIETEGGAVRETQIPWGTDEAQAGTVCTTPRLLGDQVIYGVYGSLMVWDRNTDALTRHPVWRDEEHWLSEVFLCADRALAVNEEGGCAMVELSSGEVTPLEAVLPQPVSLTEDRPVAWSGDGGLLAAEGEEKIYLWNGEGELMAEIPLDNRRVCGCSFTPDGEELLFLCSDGYLYRHSVDGAFLNRVGINRYSNTTLYTDVEWYFIDGGVALLAEKVLNVISYDGWGVSAYAADCWGYDSDRDRILCYRYQGGSYDLGGFRRYTTEELIARGHSIVGGAVLSGETKSQYGID